jgi:hypothetical protein
VRFQTSNIQAGRNEGTGIPLPNSEEKRLPEIRILTYVLPLLARHHLSSKLAAEGYFCTSYIDFAALNVGQIKSISTIAGPGLPCCFFAVICCDAILSYTLHCLLRNNFDEVYKSAGICRDNFNESASTPTKKTPQTTRIISLNRIYWTHDTPRCILTFIPKIILVSHLAPFHVPLHMLIIFSSLRRSHGHPRRMPRARLPLESDGYVQRREDECK